MSKIIGEIVKPWIKYKKLTGTYGLEIEAETDCSSDYPNGFFEEKYTSKKTLYVLPTLPNWEGHIDNSLRNFGMEFVFKKPLSYSAAITALNDFGEKTKKVDFIKGSPSTSVHVHWNITQETFKTLANFIAIYMLYENVLTAYSGPTRRSNLFALPMRVSEQIVDNFIKMVKLVEAGNYKALKWDMYQTKYGALNPANLGTLGSLEIRPFRGTTNIEEVKSWLTIIHQMVEFSRKTSVTPQTILDMYQNHPDELDQQIFQNLLSDLRATAEGEFEMLVQKNLWFLAMFVESTSDWNKFGEYFEEISDKYQEKNDLVALKMKEAIKTHGHPATPKLFGDDLQPTSQGQEWEYLIGISNGNLEVTSVASPFDDNLDYVDDIDWEDE